MSNVKRFHIAIRLDKEEIFQLKVRAAREEKTVSKLVKDMIVNKIKEE